ncbi:hypothetical protein B0H11DRAFT_1973481, partial [Mycena galericulata]
MSLLSSWLFCMVSWLFFALCLQAEICLDSLPSHHQMAEHGSDVSTAPGPLSKLSTLASRSKSRCVQILALTLARL